MSTVSSSSEFAGRGVLVTGASRNTGRAIAAAFYRAGARVWVNVRSPEDADEAVDAVKAAAADLGPAAGAAGEALAAVADMGDAKSVARLFDAIKADGRGLDVLVNNAVVQGIGPNFIDTDDAQWEEVFRVNVFGYMRAARHAAALMRAGGGGAIVNVGSNVSKRAIRDRAAYVASKGAIDSMTLALAVDLAPDIRVNCVAPGYIRTDRWDRLDDGVAARRRANTPLGKEAMGSQIAAAVMYMAGSGASAVTGARLVVDGGCSAQHMPADRDL